jgi:prevent-host-death family protein
MNITEARAQLSEVIDRVAFRGERVAIERHGKVLGAVVSAEDLELLERINAAEDAEDNAAVDRARKEKGRISWETIKRDLKIR